MWNIVVLCLSVLCCAVGMGSMLGEVWLFLWRPRSKAKRVLLVLDDGTEAQRLYMEQSLRWYGHRWADQVWFVSEREHPILTDSGAIQVCRKGELSARVAAFGEDGRSDQTDHPIKRDDPSYHLPE